MTRITIHLAKAEDGSVAVNVNNGTAFPGYRVPAEAVAAVRRQVAGLMEAFEGGHRPVTDPVALAELGGLLRDVFLTPVAGAIEAAVAREQTGLLFTSTDPECLNFPWELLPGPNGRFLVADVRCAIRRRRTSARTSSLAGRWTSSA